MPHSLSVHSFFEVKVLQNQNHIISNFHSYYFSRHSTNELLIHKKIFRFDITMHYIFSMTVFYCFTELIDKFPNIFSLSKILIPFINAQGLTSRPEGRSSRTSRRFRSTYSKTRCNLPFLINLRSSKNSALIPSESFSKLHNILMLEHT